MGADDAVVVLTTAPSEEVAVALSRALVEARAAACVQVGGGIRSIYRWKGAVEDAREVEVVIKTRAGRVDDVKRIVKATHPYEVPELVVLAVVDGSADYLAWLRAETA